MLQSPSDLCGPPLNSLSLVMRGSKPGVNTQDAALKVLNRKGRNSILVYSNKPILNGNRKHTISRALVTSSALS